MEEKSIHDLIKENAVLWKEKCQFVEQKYDRLKRKLDYVEKKEAKKKEPKKPKPANVEKKNSPPKLEGDKAKSPPKCKKCGLLMKGNDHSSCQKERTCKKCNRPIKGYDHKLCRVDKGKGEKIKKEK